MCGLGSADDLYTEEKERAWRLSESTTGFSCIGQTNWNEVKSVAKMAEGLRVPVDVIVDPNYEELVKFFLFTRLAGRQSALSSWSESVDVTAHPSLRHVSRNAMELSLE
ncbi:hypothetical protein AAG570_003955 [Ranatra chinensis]|uniref:Uncharacterized protein n=1 Tax=Ranatra chinensis TaxID=642074 RepID=A0ABD0Y4P0_9HEMI